MRFVVCLLAVLTFGVAASQQPAPRPAVGAETEKKKPTADPKRTGSKQQSASERPLIIQLLPTAKTREDTDREAQEREEKATDQRISRWSTGTNVLLTVMLVIANGGLWWYTKKSANAAKQSADAATASARAILFLAPKGITHQLVRPANFPPTPDNRTVVYVLHNFGASLGIIETMGVEAKILEDVPSREQLDALERKQVVGAWVVDGKSETRAYNYEIFISDADLARITSGNARFFFFGTVNYSDVFGSAHTTGFAFEFVPPNNFKTVGKPNELNYRA
jgi:hypothetical protein